MSVTAAELRAIIERDGQDEALSEGPRHIKARRDRGALLGLLRQVAPGIEPCAFDDNRGIGWECHVCGVKDFMPDDYEREKFPHAPDCPAPALEALR